MSRLSHRPDLVVIASHLPDEGHFRSGRFTVDAACCTDPLDYWRAFARHWDRPETIVNVEHDIEATDGHVEALVACTRPLCAWAYRCHWRSTGLPHDVIAAGTGARDREQQPDPGYLQGGEEWAAWAAIGLVKITRPVRVGVLRAEPWQSLELAVHDAVTGPWHMHWPEVPHHHW